MHDQEVAREESPATPDRRPSWARPWPVHPLLFAAYAVLFLFAENVAEVALGEVLPPLVRALIGAGFILLIAGLLLRDLRRGALIATALVLAWSAFGHVERTAHARRR